jgi:hypothetical protein
MEAAARPVGGGEVLASSRDLEGVEPKSGWVRSNRRARVRVKVVDARKKTLVRC